MQATGEVYVNGTRVPGEQTLFSGDTVRTAADGAVALMSPVFGQVVIPAQSEISFGAAPYLASLKKGSVEVRSSPPAPPAENQPSNNFGVQFGNAVMYFPDPAVASSGVITLRPDGGAEVTCGAGSVALRSVSGVELVVLHMGQSVEISSDGKLRTAEGTLIPTPQATSAPASVTGASHLGYIVIGVAAVGGITAAIILLTHRSSSSPAQPVSPSSP